MLDATCFVSATIHARDVLLPDGKKHKLHFKELAAVDFRKYGLAERSDDETERAQAMFRLIAASLVEPNGAPALTFEKALTLKPGVVTALLKEISAVNGDSGNV